MRVCVDAVFDSDRHTSLQQRRRTDVVWGVGATVVTLGSARTAPAETSLEDELKSLSLASLEADTNSASDTDTEPFCEPLGVSVYSTYCVQHAQSACLETERACCGTVAKGAHLRAIQSRCTASC